MTAVKRRPRITTEDAASEKLVLAAAALDVTSSDDADSAPTKPVPKAQVNKVVKAFTAFRKAKNAAADATKTADELKVETLLPALVEYGRAHGEKGQHLAIELPEAVDGFGVLVRRANVSRLLDIDKAEKMAEEKGVLPQVQLGVIGIRLPATELPGLLRAIKAVVKEKELGKIADVQSQAMFSQDALMAYHQQHRDEETAKETAKKAGKRKPGPVISEAEIDALIVEETTYSFHPEKA